MDWKMMENFSVDMIAGEEDFPEMMEQKILPWAKANLVDGYFNSFDGRRIHYARAINENEKATIVVSHGFCEFIPKYYEVLYYFYEMGYSVFMLEYRGHGFSQRANEKLEQELDKVYVTDYREYVEDLHGFMDQVVCKESRTGRFILFAHSMGGCIASYFLEEYPNYFKKAILSSPLHEMNFKGTSPVAVNALFILSILLHWNMKYVPGQHGFDDVYGFDHSSCLSENRYRYIFKCREDEPRYTTYGGSYAWTRASVSATKQVVRNASKIAIPVLLFQAGLDTMVEARGQNEFAKAAANVELIRYDESKHEIFNSLDYIRRDYYKKIFDFIGDM